MTMHVLRISASGFETIKRHPERLESVFDESHRDRAEIGLAVTDIYEPLNYRGAAAFCERAGMVAIDDSDDPVLRDLGVGGTLEYHATYGPEVHRPDRTILTALIAAPLDARALQEAAAAATDAVLERSPRLNALLLAHVREDSARTRRAVEEYLETRIAPFALIARPGPDGEYGIAPRSFPGKQAFVAYGDERALHGAARALGMVPGSYAIAAMPPRKLFAWASSVSTPLLLCAYEDPADLTSQAWHVPFAVEDLRRLAGA